MQKQKIEDIDKSTFESQNFDKNNYVLYTHQKLSIKIAMISVFAALAIGSSYALAPLINIELMSFLLFLAGFLYGKYVGIFVGLISSAIYYGWNPFGVPALPLYVVCVTCMIFIGLMGGILKISAEQKRKVEMNPLTILKFAAIGFFYTALFDIATNIVYAYFYYAGDIILALTLGIPFMIIHLISNTILFAFLTIPVYNTVISIQ